MKSIYLLVISLSMTLTTAAQLQVMGSAGGEATNNAGSFSWTMGETVINTIEGTGNRITQGFQQGNLHASTGIDKSEDFGVEMKVYPNPTKDYLTVETQKQSGNLVFALYDINGRMLKNGGVEASRFDINLSSYPPGSYILQILHNSDLVKSFNIVKLK